MTIEAAIPDQQRQRAIALIVVERILTKIANGHDTPRNRQQLAKALDHAELVCRRTGDS